MMELGLEVVLLLVERRLVLVVGVEWQLVESKVGRMVLVHMVLMLHIHRKGKGNHKERHKEH